MSEIEKCLFAASECLDKFATEMDAANGRLATAFALRRALMETVNAARQTVCAAQNHSLGDPEVRRQVLAMTDGKCTYCACAVSDEPVEGQSVKLFVEHVVPSSKGGPNNLVNYVPSCGSCNSAKGDRHVLHFVA